jgi:hypothetical protein
LRFSLLGRVARNTDRARVLTTLQPAPTRPTVKPMPRTDQEGEK